MTPSEPIPGEPISVNGGLVETRDPVHFNAGDLLEAQDAYYKPNDPAIWSVPGRTAFNNVPAGASIIGLRYLEYDGATDKIVIHVGSKYREATAALLGTFADATGAGTGLTAAGVVSFDSCHYNNQHILLDGVNRNVVRQSDGTYRFQGMLANTGAPSIANTGVGTGFNLSSGNVITYWVEERVKVGGVTVRRNASPATAIVTLTGPQTLVKPVVTRPAVVNSDATHWGLIATAINGGWPVGFEVGEAVIATTTIEDTRTGTDPGAPAGAYSYETVAAVLPGTTIISLTPKWGPPPIATSADVQEDSVVMNDVSDKSKVWFNYPDNIDAVPGINFIRFETKEADEVQWVHYLGQATIVALRNSLWKINILPEASDSTFQTNRVKSQIEGAHGGVGPMSVATFSFGDRNLVAYASRAGIFATDGEVWHLLTGDVDWVGRVDISQLPRSILTHNPRDFRLEFTYTPVGGTLNSATLFLHVHPSQTKPSNLGIPEAKVTTATRGGNARALANIAGQDIILSAQTNGRVYVEWTGLVDPLGPIQFRVRTGEKFPFKIGHWGRSQRTWVHHEAGTPDQRLIVGIVSRTEGQEDTAEQRTIPMKRREHTSFYADAFGEAFEYFVQADDPPAQVAINFFIGEYTDMGRSNVAGEA